MKVVFCRSHSLGSLFLRTAMWSSWSHCGIVTPAGTVIEARAWHGVTERPLAELMAQTSEHALREIPVPDDARALEYARSQVGKPYDWHGLIGLGLRREWQRPDAWFCSELVEAAARAGGRIRFLHNVQRITPQHSWMVA